MPANRACIIGAGPAGLYAARLLDQRGFLPTLFEKSGSVLGNYRYASAGTNPFQDVVANPNIKINLGTDHTAARDSDCDFYIVAAGGRERVLDVEGAELCTMAMDVVKNHRTLGYVGDSVCIVGMGNVAMDLIGYLADKCRRLTVLCRSEAGEAAFSNHKLRDVVEKGRWAVGTNAGTEDSEGETRRMRERKKILRGGRLGTGAELVLSFGSRVERIRACGERGEQREVEWRTRGEYQREVFDRVISSVGFVPWRPELETSKPVHYAGWSSGEFGSLGEAQRSASRCVSSIVEEMR
jgi:thioredoxin reductase